MRLILPKNYVVPDPAVGPVFYLLGPVLGGGDWQKEACELLTMFYGEQCWIASPVRYDVNDPFRRHEVEGENGRFFRQAQWERCYMDLAAKEGCIIAWLPVESKTNPRKDGMPYAMDTRGELGEWRGRMMKGEKVNLVIGGDSGFPGLDTIRFNFSEALGNRIPLYPDLEFTVGAAVDLAGRR